ncbi:MAG: hypothetical protein Q9215_001269 [Flavoplaca cf. flavocitrina]
MHFIKSLFVTAACVAAAVAQLLAFTDVPASVTPGERVTLGWGGGNSESSVKIDLYQGDYRDLQFVRTITNSGNNGQYVWTVPADLPNRNDYSLQISRGLDDNYSGPFQLTGSNAVSSVSPSQSQTASASASSTASNAVTTNGGVVVVQSVVASNITTTISDNNATTTVPAIGTGVGASGSAATGTAMSRNTTMARPTLSSTSSESAATTEGSTSEPTGDSSTGGEEEAPSSGAIAMEVASFASPLALVVSAVAAIMFLA